MKPIKGPRKRPASEHFWAKVNRGSSSECWEWTATTSRAGYGIFAYRGERGDPIRTILAHRFAYEFAVGSLPPRGYDLHHRCKNKACVNPHHLEPLTRREHVRLTPRQPKTECPRGHAYEPDNLGANRHGWRVCLICKRDASARERREAKA
jgi:hypothetical protein